MKLLTMKAIEDGVMEQANKVIKFIKKHKKIIAVLTILYIAVNFLFSEDED